MIRFLVILLLPLFCHSQTITKENYITAGLVFVSGMADGTSELLYYHYDKCSNIFKNEQFWNGKISHTNKYSSNCPFATTMMVWTTDGYHLMRFVRNGTMIGAITININEKKSWKRYLIEFTCYYIVYTIGFNLTYDIIF